MMQRRGDQEIEWRTWTSKAGLLAVMALVSGNHGYLFFDIDVYARITVVYVGYVDSYRPF